MNSISHKWISCSFYYPRTYELCPVLKPTVSRCETIVCSVLNKLTLLKFEIHMEELKKKYTPYTESERMSYIFVSIYRLPKRSISLPSVRVFAVVC